MARATGSRSQRQASQSQPQPTQNGRSQTQRNGRRGRVEGESDDEEEVNNGMDEDDDGEGRGDDDIERKANDLVRLALFNEQRRLPLRRDEISKRVMGSKSRRFADVLARAQDILRKTFGMELVELHNRAEDKDNDVKKEKKDAVGMAKKAAPTGTKTWILRSVFSPRLIQLAASPDAEILQIEQGDAEADEQHVKDDDDEDAPALTGAILAWQSGDSLGTVGLLYVILSLILVNGRALGDNDLRTYLRRLRLQPTNPVPLTARSTHAAMTVDQFLALSIRQGYLEKLRVGETKATKKRGRAAAATQNGNAEEVAWEWRWGPRSMAEVGEADIARFVSEFMVERARAEAGEDDEDEAPRGQTTKDAVYKGIERAAGGELLEVR